MLNPLLTTPHEHQIACETLSQTTPDHSGDSAAVLAQVPHWSRLGRLKRTKLPNLSGGGHVFGGGASQGIMTVLAGRLLCDTYLAARELVKEVDYTLKTLSHSLLQQERHELSASDVPGNSPNQHAIPILSLERLLSFWLRCSHLWQESS